MHGGGLLDTIERILNIFYSTCKFLIQFSPRKMTLVYVASIISSQIFAIII